MNLSLEYDNIESSLCKVAAEMLNIFPKALYDRLVDAYEAHLTPHLTPGPSPNGEGGIVEPDGTAVNYLQRAMLHFAIYEHLIFLITQVSNDGVTVKKNDNETTAYKYQTDELNNKLITTAWFWINQLIGFLDGNLADFPEWSESEEKKDYDNLPVGLADFNKWVGVTATGGEYFMMYAGWLIREVWMDCVCSRFTPVLTPGPSPNGEGGKSDKVARAVCYEVMGRACQVLAYSCLPEPVRKDFDDMGQQHRVLADRDIRERVSERFLGKASVYWNDVDLELKRIEMAANRKTVGSRPIVGREEIRESDGFYYS
jgi:hypothetical protein